MITLRSQELLVRLDPAHGAEILDLVDLSSGRQLLGRPPFGSEPIQGGDLDEGRWTRSYRGGWQTVLPNAGNAGDNATGHHGFHGRASNDPWELLEQAEGHARLAWSGHGLEVEKLVVLHDGAVSVSYRIAAPRGASLVALEHVSVGLELLEPEVRLELPAGLAYEPHEQDGPTAPPSDATRFPVVRLLDGSTERLAGWYERRLPQRRVRQEVSGGAPPRCHGRSGRARASTGARRLPGRRQRGESGCVSAEAAPRATRASVH